LRNSQGNRPNPVSKDDMAWLRGDLGLDAIRFTAAFGGR
jgi:hypothetical protein